MINEYLNEDKYEYKSEQRPVEIINMTPHPVVFVAKDGRKLSFEPSGRIARTARTPSVIDRLQVDMNGEVFEIPIVETLHTLTDDKLPEPKRGVFYIVSGFYAEAYPEREDLLIPNTAANASLGAVRDNSTGKVVGVRALRTNRRYRHIAQ